MKPPSRACRTRGISLHGRGEPRHDLAPPRTGAPARPPDVHRRAARPTVRLGVVPPRGNPRESPAADSQVAVGDAVGRVGVPAADSMPATRACASASTSSTRPWARRRAGPGLGRPGRLCSPPHIWRARRIASTRSTRASPAGAAPRMCRPSRIWTSLISQSQPSTCRMKSSNSVLVRPLLEAEVVVQLRGLHQRPDLLADRRQLGRVERRDVRVLVEQLLEPRDVAVGLGPGHRRDEVVDERGVRPALGLRPLPRVVDQERVDQRQVAERRVGPARRAHPQRLAGQPLEVAVLAEVHDRVRAEPALALRRGEPAVGTPGSGGSAAGPDRGRSPPGSRRSRAAAARSARRCRSAGRRRRCRSRRRTAHRAPDPSAPRRPCGSRRASVSNQRA